MRAIAFFLGRRREKKEEKKSMQSPITSPSKPSQESVSSPTRLFRPLRPRHDSAPPPPIKSLSISAPIAKIIEESSSGLLSPDEPSKPRDGTPRRHTRRPPPLEARRNHVSVGVNEELRELKEPVQRANPPKTTCPTPSVHLRRTSESGDHRTLPPRLSLSTTDKPAPPSCAQNRPRARSLGASKTPSVPPIDFGALPALPKLPRAEPVSPSYVQSDTEVMIRGRKSEPSIKRVGGIWSMKRAMPELDAVWDGFLKDVEEDTKTLCEPAEITIAPSDISKRQSRAPDRALPLPPPAPSIGPSPVTSTPPESPVSLRRSSLKPRPKPAIRKTLPALTVGGVPFPSPSVSPYESSADERPSRSIYAASAASLQPQSPLTPGSSSKFAYLISTPSQSSLSNHETSSCRSPRKSAPNGVTSRARPTQTSPTKSLSIVTSSVTSSSALESESDSEPLLTPPATPAPIIWPVSPKRQVPSEPSRSSQPPTPSKANFANPLPPPLPPPSPRHTLLHPIQTPGPKSPPPGPKTPPASATRFDRQVQRASETRIPRLKKSPSPTPAPESQIPQPLLPPSRLIQQRSSHQLSVARRVPSKPKMQGVEWGYAI